MGKSAEQRPVRYLKDGHVDYHSKSLVCTQKDVKGYLYKMAKEPRFFSFQKQYYSRYFTLDLQLGCMFI